MKPQKNPHNSEPYNPGPYNPGAAESAAKQSVRKENSPKQRVGKESVGKESAGKESAGKDEQRKESVKVSIMQREFSVACTAEERHDVVEAAAYFDKQMRAVSKGAQVLGIDRCAIMAGLNISHELLALRKSVSENERLDSRLESLHRQVDKVVESFQS